MHLRWIPIWAIIVMLSMACTTEPDGIDSFDNKEAIQANFDAVPEEDASSAWAGTWTWSYSLTDTECPDVLDLSSFEKIKMATRVERIEDVPLACQLTILTGDVDVESECALGGTTMAAEVSYHVTATEGNCPGTKTIILLLELDDSGNLIEGPVNIQARTDDDCHIAAWDSNACLAQAQLRGQRIDVE